MLTKLGLRSRHCSDANCFAAFSGSVFMMFSLIGLGVISMTGCQRQEEIQTYQTPKDDAVFAENHVERQAQDAPVRPAPPRMTPPMSAPTGQPGEKVRVFAAISHLGEQIWFYKITGPVEAVAEKADQVAEFVSGVDYKDNAPVWTLPEGWEQKAGNQFRFATLVIPTSSTPVEMSVTVLGGNPSTVTDQVLDNINRWRGQVSLENIDKAAIEGATDDLQKETSLRKGKAGSIYFVNLVGAEQDTGMRPPFAR